MLRLRTHGFELVADDRVEVVDGIAPPPPALAGLLEVRGLGIFRLPYAAEARLALVVDLAPVLSLERPPAAAGAARQAGPATGSDRRSRRLGARARGIGAGGRARSRQPGRGNLRGMTPAEGPTGGLPRARPPPIPLRVVWSPACQAAVSSRCSVRWKTLGSRPSTTRRWRCSPIWLGEASAGWRSGWTPARAASTRRGCWKRSRRCVPTRDCGPSWSMSAPTRNAAAPLHREPAPPSAGAAGSRLGWHRQEQALTLPLREAADLVVDTSDLPIGAMRRRIEQHFGADTGTDRLVVTLLSFAYPQSLPREADLVFDSRFLRNPHYNPSLRARTGLDPEVGAFIRPTRISRSFSAGWLNWSRCSCRGSNKRARNTRPSRSAARVGVTARCISSRNWPPD